MTEALLAALQSRANHRGLILARSEALQDALDCSFHDLQAALATLTTSGAITILAPLPFLVAKLGRVSNPVAPQGQSWSGSDRELAKTAPKSGAAPARAYSFQSSLSRSKQLMKESYSEVGTDALLAEVLETLGESDPTTFRGALRAYSPAVIRTALTRVRKMHQVRKSRTALFRFLLPRIAQERPSIN